ncbi:WG repeat-containing protein [Actinoplanes xinjiangensis]|nr:WG repeat-containing protein [Actinoplanes xinjiangensis]
MRIVRLKAAPVRETPSHDVGTADDGSAAEHDAVVTESTNDEITEMSAVVVSDAVLPSNTAANAEDAVEPDTVVIAGEPATVLINAEPDTVLFTAEPEPEPEPETAALVIEPDTVVLSAEPETTVLGTEPDTVLLRAKPETGMLVAEPDTVMFHTESEPDTVLFSAEPETAALNTESGTGAVDGEPETAAFNTETQTDAVDTEAETAALNTETETGEVDGEPETAAFAVKTETVERPENAAAADVAAGAVSAADGGVEVPDVRTEADGDGDPGETATAVAGEVEAGPAAVGDDERLGGPAGGAPGVPLQGVTSETTSGSAAEAAAETASRSGPPEAKPEAESTAGGPGEGAAATADGGRVEPVRQRRDQRAPADRRRADPEQILAAYPWAYDPQTLREQVDDPDRLWDVADRLTDRLEFAERDNVRAGLLSLRAVVHRIVGELDDALADGRDGLRHAEAAGELRTVAIAQARLAHVLQWRGEFEEADRLYAEADSVELPPRTRAEIRELAGRSAYEQGRYLEAVNHFERALDVRRGEDPELVERIELALDAITRRSGAAGWGPYPRNRDEVLGRPEAPVPLLDDGAGLWGYAAAIEPRFAEAQPFSEGAAWVRRPDSAAWELIDAHGELIIAAAHGYTGVTRFAEGLAWVSRPDQGGWFAIDRENRLVVPAGGFEDVRPFRRGLAVVRQGGVWGAVDRHGRVTVPPRYQRFVTALHFGGTVDGFTDEGLAVVGAGDRFGVVDRSGRLLVEPVHAAVVIHPVAFLVRDAAGLWAALDRSGAPMAGMGDRDLSALVDALPEETRPVL